MYLWFCFYFVRGEVGDWMKDVNGLIKEHLCMTHGHRQHTGIDGGKTEDGVGWSEKGGENQEQL